MSFQYKVRDPLGNYHEGSIEASSVEDATQQLRRDGFSILDLSEDDDDAGLSLFAKRVGKADVIYATSQLAIMLDTGVNLSSALEGIVAQEKNPTFKRIMTELKLGVDGGEDFSSALARHPKLFDKTYVSLVRASETTGSLGTMLDRISRYLRKELETRGKVRAAMAYPTVMMVLAICVTIFLLTFVLPKFTPLFNRRGMVLPAPTVVMMTISATLMNYWYLWIGGAISLIAGFVFGRKTERGREIWDWIKINLPIAGPMFRKVIISRSIRTLGTMVRSGVPMLDALELTADVAGNYHYEKHWRRVAEEVAGGNQIHTSLAGNPLFPAMLVQMISAGEGTGKLDVVLDRVSDYFDQEVETSLKTVTSLIEPLMITVMGFIVGGIGMVLLLPIFQLKRNPG